MVSVLFYGKCLFIQQPYTPWQKCDFNLCMHSISRINRGLGEVWFNFELFGFEQLQNLQHVQHVNTDTQSVCKGRNDDTLCTHMHAMLQEMHQLSCASCQKAKNAPWTWPSHTRPQCNSTRRGKPLFTGCTVHGRLPVLEAACRSWASLYNDTFSMTPHPHLLSLVFHYTPHHEDSSNMFEVSKSTLQDTC